MHSKQISMNTFLDFDSFDVFSGTHWSTLWLCCTKLENHVLFVAVETDDPTRCPCIDCVWTIFLAALHIAGTICQRHCETFVGENGATSVARRGAWWLCQTHVFSMFESIDGRHAIAIATACVCVASTRALFATKTNGPPSPRRSTPLRCWFFVSMFENLHGFERCSTVAAFDASFLG